MPPHMSVTYVEVSLSTLRDPSCQPVMYQRALYAVPRWHYGGAPTDTITMGQVRLAAATRPPISDFAESSCRVARAKGSQCRCSFARGMRITGREIRGELNGKFKGMPKSTDELDKINVDKIKNIKKNRSLWRLYLIGK